MDIQSDSLLLILNCLLHVGLLNYDIIFSIKN